MPRALGKLLIKYFKKEEPSSKVNSLKDLCSFSTFTVALGSHCQGRKRVPRRFSDGESIFLTLQVPALDREELKANSRRRGGVLHWRRIRTHVSGAGVGVWVRGAFFSYSGGLQPSVPVHTIVRMCSHSHQSRSTYSQQNLYPWRKAAFLLLVLHPQWQSRKCGRENVQRVDLAISNLQLAFPTQELQCFLLNPGFLNASGPLAKGAYLAAVVRHSAHVCHLGKLIFFCLVASLFTKSVY